MGSLCRGTHRYQAREGERGRLGVRQTLSTDLSDSCHNDTSPELAHHNQQSMAGPSHNHQINDNPRPEQEVMSSLTHFSAANSEHSQSQWDVFLFLGCCLLVTLLFSVFEPVCFMPGCK